MSASQSQLPSKSKLQRQNATAFFVAKLAAEVAKYPLNVVRTRFQVNDGRISYLPTYKNTVHALFTISRVEGLKGLYAGFGTAIFGSALSSGLYILFFARAKKRHLKNNDAKLSSFGIDFGSALEATALVSLCANPIFVVKTRLQLQIPLHQARPNTGILQVHTPPHQNRPYYGLNDGLKTIMREEGWRALYKGVVPSLLQVSYSIIKIAAYEELCRVVVGYKSKERKKNCKNAGVSKLNTLDHAVLGASSAVAATLLTYPFLQRPSTDGIPRYMGGWHLVKETVWFEGFRGFYKGITPHLLKATPLASVTFIVYEKVLKLLKLEKRND